MLFSIQLLIILICLFYGARKGGIALGLLGGIGLVILVFVFHLQPSKPPVDVMLVIILVDDKGNDFFQQIVSKQCANCAK